MNFGIQDIQNIIYNQLVQGNANVTGGRGKFAKDLAKRIFELVEQPMNIDMKTEARARGVSEISIKMSEKIGKALGFDVMPLSPAACIIYEWVMEQEAKGEKIEIFAAWAKSPERLSFIRMYRKDAENIKIDWPRAFIVNTVGRTAEMI